MALSRSFRLESDRVASPDLKNRAGTGEGKISEHAVRSQ